MDVRKEIYKALARGFRGIALRIDELISLKENVEGLAKKLEDNVQVVPGVISSFILELQPRARELTENINAINLINQGLYKEKF